ncbi:DUF202 domain-containing protein [Nocardia goodfellowii]
MNRSSRDAGLQAERTALAWRRTAASATVVALLLAYLSTRLGSARAGTISCAGAALTTLALVSFRRDRQLRLDYRSMSRRTASTVAGAVLATSSTVAFVIVAVH